MDQFINSDQASHYDATRPKYSQEIFLEILKNVNSFENYLDVACGTGQLLIPLSPNFNFSVGVDVSSVQLAQAKINLQNLSKIETNNVLLYQCDAYQIREKLKQELIGKPPEEVEFDLITVGQAFHWFEEVKFLNFIKSILHPKGVLILAGYKKQHFDKNQ